ncbi:MAG TPA: aspartate ammonia-lyase [Candidatus Nanoarchaeia archaeon]|nr:aspartate ammonia-lyase [Candidatus Nanoarchaeia archaeon]
MTRIEKDALGKKAVPTDAYYGIHTQRASENFQISGKICLEMFHTIALIKIAAACAHRKLKLLDVKKSSAIEKASKEILAGKFDDQFIVDIYQAGAGTATHMNVNEVIANRATEILGGKKGSYIVHSNDHVNMSQSTNDVFPTAMRILLLQLSKHLLSALYHLEQQLHQKAQLNKLTWKSGRTHLQDAVPMTWAQEIEAWAVTVHDCQERIEESLHPLKELSIGGTAIGTGTNTHPKYKALVVKELRSLTHLPLKSKQNLIEATQSMADFTHFSGALRETAVELARISKDIQLLSSGPRTGLHELLLPAVEPGSSIMPGKVNPSMAEMLCMVCYQVIGYDKAVEIAALSGNLELNVNMPLIAHNLIDGTAILTHAIKEFDERCVRGMNVNKKVSEENYKNSQGMATFLNPLIGYAKAAEITQIADREHKDIVTIIRERKILSEKQIRTIFKTRQKPPANGLMA